MPLCHTYLDQISKLRNRRKIYGEERELNYTDLSFSKTKMTLAIFSYNILFALWLYTYENKLDFTRLRHRCTLVVNVLDISDERYILMFSLIIIASF